MAFLRSVTRCNQSLAVSRKFSSSVRSGEQRRGNVFATLNNATFSRAELLSCQKYYYDLRRDINTSSSHDNEQKSSMSTLAATKKTPFSSAASASNDANQPQRDPLDVSFNDPIAAFKSKTTWELIRAYFVYLMCSSEYLVENNMKVMNGVWKERKKKWFIWTIDLAVTKKCLHFHTDFVVPMRKPKANFRKQFHRRQGASVSAKNIAHVE